MQNITSYLLQSSQRFIRTFRQILAGVTTPKLDVIFPNYVNAIKPNTTIISNYTIANIEIT